ncbi:MAG: transposase [Candidatus Brocadiaceae bacterium]
MLEVRINVSEIKEVIKDIAEAPGKIFTMMRYNVRESVGRYLSHLMDSELTFTWGGSDMPGGDKGEVNYRNGGYTRQFTLKGIGEVRVRVPRDRKGRFETSVLPRSKQYEDQIQEDLGLLFLTGVSTRTLSLISNRLVGRSLSHEEVSEQKRADRW